MTAAPLQIYFFLEPDVHYDDALAYLAEGLRGLGVACHGNREHWWTGHGDTPAIFATPLAARRWDAIVLSNTAYRYDTIDAQGNYRVREHAPDLSTLAQHSERIVLLDVQDGYSTHGESEPRITHIFRAKFNSRCAQAAKSRPYVLGVQERVLALAPRPPMCSENAHRVLDTFNFTHPYAHGTRTIFREQIAPRLEQLGFAVDRCTGGSLRDAPTDPTAARWWRLSGGKHNPEYYELIRRYPMHACFCGEIIPTFPRDPQCVLAGGRRAKLRRRAGEIIDRILGDRGRLVQWDSWRFWETLALGSVPLLFDLEQLGVRLPVMPTNWTHYVGLDVRHPERSLQQLKERWAELPKIAVAGRTWLVEHYAPTANARRVLDELDLSARL